ncbi:MAG: hypothetical protein LBD67_03480 [Candidatus Accumulibacter sp.]|jgi:hypothetical protein|nr:hypothetical protein [Accumulibacter sp.]
MRGETSEYSGDLRKPFSAGLFFTLLLACANACGLSGNDALFQWRLVNQERNEDGGRTMIFQLEGIGKEEGIPDVIYKSSPRKNRRDRNRTFGPPEFYRKQTGAGQTDFRIYSGRPELIELWARIRRGNGFHYAQTLFAAFGQSGLSDRQSERMESFPDWPAFRLSAGKNFYRAQTGTELTVQITPVPVGMRIYENRVPRSNPSVDAKGLYRYTPPHEANLSKSGFSSKKDLLFVADLPDGQGALSFYLPVFRAYYGQISLKSGLAVLLFTVMLSLAFIWFLNRKFPWR